MENGDLFRPNSTQQNCGWRKHLMWPNYPQLLCSRHNITGNGFL